MLAAIERLQHLPQMRAGEPVNVLGFIFPKATMVDFRQKSSQLAHFYTHPVTAF